MIIKWFGQNCLQIKSKNRIVVFDPFKDQAGLKMSNLRADILVVSKNSKKIDTKKIKARKKGDVYTIDSPGEYEVKDIMVNGIPAKDGVTIYIVYLENVSIAFLADLSQKKLTDKQLQSLNNVDILLLPVGDNKKLAVKDAIEISQQIEPNLIIPINYKTTESKTDLQDATSFLKTEGGTKIEPLPDVKIVQSKLPEETEIIVLKP